MKTVMMEDFQVGMKHNGSPMMKSLYIFVEVYMLT